VRFRTDASRGFKKIDNVQAMIWRLLIMAQKSWRALNAPRLMREVRETKLFEDGVAIRARTTPTRRAA